MPIVLVSGIVIFRILDGKIAEIWHEENFIEALRQLGIPTIFPPGVCPREGPLGELGGVPHARAARTKAMQPAHVYEVRPRKHHRGVDLISDALQ